jgi:hypothetical protein
MAKKKKVKNLNRTLRKLLIEVLTGMLVAVITKFIEKLMN